jgi:hypothetical protein
MPAQVDLRDGWMPELWWPVAAMSVGVRMTGLTWWVVAVSIRVRMARLTWRVVAEAIGVRIPVAPDRSDEHRFQGIRLASSRQFGRTLV